MNKDTIQKYFTNFISENYYMNESTKGVYGGLSYFDILGSMPCWFYVSPKEFGTLIRNAFEEMMINIEPRVYKSASIEWRLYPLTYVNRLKYRKSYKLMSIPEIDWATDPSDYRNRMIEAGFYSRDGKWFAEPDDVRPYRLKERALLVEIEREMMHVRKELFDDLIRSNRIEVYEKGAKIDKDLVSSYWRGKANGQGAKLIERIDFDQIQKWKEKK